MSEEKNTNHPMDELLNEGKSIKIPKVGDLVEGSVISISKNEVYLDLDGITTGIIRGKEIYDESDENSSLKVGDKATATIVDLDNESGYLELSFREAGHQKAWNNLEKLKKEETIVESKVIDANKGGLMIKIGNVLGFLPVSQLTIEHYPRIEGGDKSKILTHLKSFAGQSLKTKIIDMDEKEEKLIVSEKAAWNDKQKKNISKYKVGNKVNGKVTGVVKFGAFVEFGEGLEGLVHISELAWQRIDDPRDVIRVGDKVSAEIIEIDNTKISLSIKKLQSDPWANIDKKYKKGDIVRGKVMKVNPFGAFVELDKDIHGLVHISELSNKKVNDPENILKAGKEYDFTILNIEPKDHRLGLSYKTSKEKVKKNNKKEGEKVKKEKKEKTKKEIKEDIKEKVEDVKEEKTKEKVKEDIKERVKEVKKDKK